MYVVPINYVERVVDLVDQALPGLEPELLRLYALLALTVGAECTYEHVHDAWSLWRTQEMPDHRSVVPFAELSDEVKELDAAYAAGIRFVAAQITEGSK